MNFKFGELFSGPGGLALGARLAKVVANGQLLSISHAWSTDYDKDTCATYRHNFCPDNPKSVVCCDIRKLNLRALKKISDIDALAFGFPCNDFSVVGEQRGMDGIYGPLYSYGVEALKYFKPKFFLAENVGGLRNANDGKTINKIFTELQQAGYVITPHLYKFEQYGVPQARHRIIIKGAKISQIYKRLDPDKPAYTITGSWGGGTHVYHWKENRALTNRERARLQAFPDAIAKAA